MAQVLSQDEVDALLSAVGDGDLEEGGVCPCAVDTFGTSVYMTCNDQQDWWDAQLACETYGYDLVKIEDISESNWLKPTGSGFWTGLNDLDTEGVWLWFVDDSPLDPSLESPNSNWVANEPNNAMGDEHCMMLTSVGWNDYPCTNTRGYICEAPLDAGQSN